MKLSFKGLVSIFEPLLFSFRFTGNRKRLLYIIFVAALVASVTRLLVPVYIGQSITALEQGKSSLVGFFLVLIITVSVITAVSQFFINYLSQKLAQWYAFNLRTVLLDRLLRKKGTFMDSRTSGDLLSRSTMDIEASRNFILNTASQLISTILLIVIALYLLISINPIFALFFLAAVPLLVRIGMVFQRKQRTHWRKIRMHYGTMNERLQENIVGQRVVRGYNGMQSEFSRFSGTTSDYYDEYMEVAQLRGFYNNLMPFIVGAAATAVILYGGYIDLLTGSTVGGLVAAVNIFIMVSMPVSFLGRIIVFSENARAGIDRIKEVIDSGDEETYDNNGIVPQNYDLVFRDVSFYRGTREVLRSINLRIGFGEKIAITGRLGSGKSTLVSLISRIYDPSSGVITIGGVSITDVPLVTLRKIVALVPQGSNILSGTIFENIAFGRDVSLDEVQKACKTAQIADFIESLEQKYNTLVGERGITLSGGQKQRLLVARALVGKPKILILDDATSSVDPETELAMLNSISTSLNGVTLIIVSHRPSVLRFSERKVRLENGKITEEEQLPRNYVDADNNTKSVATGDE
ncbi:MAG: ABC transporter ATP-binding protein/permease [Candidatus Thermoplasmatota archaeon]|nr:ABC transporter ATP-binding protein/permease [Candidatus Thermoplasmatota archaeon]MCL5731267.1 ABC transporter ATP-binding protein/permease [Candidatus Thermoplasmatota archaeon]